MKKLLILVALVVTNAFAYTEDPRERFSVAQVNANNIQVSFIITKNIQATCDAESKRRGFGGFGIAVDACSFWEPNRNNNKCTVVIGEQTNYHTIGHEMRHCLQGNFHKW